MVVVFAGAADEKARTKDAQLVASLREIADKAAAAVTIALASKRLSILGPMRMIAGARHRGDWAAALALAACSPQPEPRKGTEAALDDAFDVGRLEIVNDAGETIGFDIYLARNGEQQRRGLMFVRNLPATTGMLFIYQGEEMRSMWMKNTYIPLDMGFARADGSVSSVLHDVEPLTLTARASREPVRYVLELNAGTARRFGIGNRSRIVWDE